MTDEEKVLCRKAIADYKKIRPVVQLGDIYRLVSPYDRLGVASLMYTSPEKDKAVFYWWKTEHFVNQHLPRVTLAGLDPDKKYRISELNRIDNQPLAFEGKTFSGAFLMENGLEIPYTHRVDYHKQNDYASRGVFIEPSEVFISDGAKSDCGNIGDMLRHDNSIGVTDPVYPVYIDSNVMSGRTGVLENGKWSDVVYIPCTEENNFVPDLPSRRVDILYLCYPNNPTGTTLTKDELKKWVNYALANDVLIMYDSAYEAYIQDPNIPHSIYEIKGAKKVAIEFRSFSKTAGFTGIRCGYTVVPKELNAFTLDGQRVQLNKLWNRRQCTKFNGTSYITQRGAEAVYSTAGKQQVTATINYYMTNAKIMKEGLQNCGLTVYGGDNAPYLWLKTPDGLSSWKFF